MSGLNRRRGASRPANSDVDALKQDVEVLKAAYIQDMLNITNDIQDLNAKITAVTPAEG